MKLNNSLHICITGGAGYIGSHIVMNILENSNHTITIIDNLSTGNTKTIGSLKFHAKRKNRLLNIVILDLINKNDLLQVFENSNFDAVFHLASSSQVNESNDNPNVYKENNLQSTKNILECMEEYSVKYLVFSSSASIYESKNDKLSENSLVSPSNVYEETKIECENIIKKFENSIKYINLRFFNVVGCDYKYRIRKRDNPESKLISVIAKAIIGDKTFYVNGDSYNTKDGTCIRDFIHVEDLAGYSLAALSYMLDSNRNNTINCGYSTGYSIVELIEVMKFVSKKDLKMQVLSKREGDYSSIVADTSMLELTLGRYYEPIYKNDIERIGKQAYNLELLNMDMR